MTTCPYLKDNNCLVVEQTCGQQYFPTQKVCMGCNKDNPPQNNNSITNIISGGILKLPLMQKTGSLIKQYLPWFIDSPPNCNCGNRIQQLNEDTQHPRQILRWIRESALDSNTEYNELYVGALVHVLTEARNSSDPSQ